MSERGVYGFLRGLVYVPFRLIFPVKVIGKENLPLPQKVITVSNHLSALDFLVVGINVKGFRHIIAKKELTKNGFARFIINKAGAIPVDRGAADLSAMRKILGALKKGEGITIFPEGTRNKSGEDLQEVKAGAAMFALKGDAQVVPVMIYRKQRAFRRNYLYIGKPFSLASYAGKRADSAAIERASHRIEAEMHSARDYLVDYVENKRAKEIKRERRAAKKRLKGYAAEAKKAEKNLGKVLKSL